MCFPYPVPRHPRLVLLVGVATVRTAAVCVRTGCLSAASNALVTQGACAVEDTRFHAWFFEEQDTLSLRSFNLRRVLRLYICKEM